MECADSTQLLGLERGDRCHPGPRAGRCLCRQSW